MQRISEVMTREVRSVSRQENLQRAAQMMDELNVGSLPVCDGERLVGIVTDRDITVRGVATGKIPREATVSDVMTDDVRWAFEDQPLDDVMIQMADSKVRRIPVVSHDEQKRLVGMVALGDLATMARGGEREEVEGVLETVSTPSTPGRTTGTMDVAGRTGQGGAGQAVDGAATAGTSIPKAGQSGIGVAGASGDPGSSRSGATGDPRRNFGVSGEDLGGDGLPPA